MKKKKGTNLYEKKITLGRDDNGTPVRKSITARTIAELNKRIENARQVWMQMHGLKDGVQIATYLRKWLTDTKAVRSIATKNMYKNIIETHLVPEIGELYFSEVTLSDLQAIINNNGHYNTCNKIKLTLKQAYTAAIADGYATDIGVARLVLPPKTQKKKRALTPAERDAIFTCDFTDAQRIFVKLLYYTGLRREEALALTADDITDCVTVSRTLIFDGNNSQIKPTPKTAAGNRSIPIPDAFLKELTYYVNRHKILFPMPTNENRYMSQSSYTKFWAGIIRTMSAVVPSASELTAHIFRHNYATLLYYSNVSIKMAAKLMGHKDIKMIMEIYAHLDELKENTREKLNTVFT